MTGATGDSFIWVLPSLWFQPNGLKIMILFRQQSKQGVESHAKTLGFYISSYISIRVLQQSESDILKFRGE